MARRTLFMGQTSLHIDYVKSCGDYTIMTKANSRVF
ncbi:Hypothetical Protein CTN_0194 [Thermotoga neapolitana DSM 4359]|uniref:Uncharacterized protein n=1 Tax=Thermotoga neapolitana (strain ATCC 49049 / DSM 4359 / NBRC 107923 / NS-E) TaxID=309803 RepID=B9KBH4_THENN|nr:Hypothetical Protein CTN_0194 [Thermotoga neapolitana DSM 4359]